jgi:hypothetical protein
MSNTSLEIALAAIRREARDSALREAAREIEGIGEDLMIEEGFSYEQLDFLAFRIRALRSKPEGGE